MREIKFRAWDGKRLDYSPEFDGFFEGGSPVNSFNKDGREFMQYTGLKDKNGKEIYEGDKVKRGELAVSTIGFHEGAFVILEGDNEPLSHYNHEDWEVIGNVHEGDI